MLAAKPTNIKTGKPITEEELTKDSYTGKDFDDELFVDMRTPAMCADLFKLLCENGGPEQKSSFSVTAKSTPTASPCK